MQTDDHTNGSTTTPTRNTRALLRITGLLAGKQVGLLKNLTITNIGPECFAAEWTRRGRRRSVVAWRGENYTPQRLGLRVRLHNRLVAIISARHPNGITQ